MIIVSKFPGTCKTCGGRFAKGNQIEWSRAGGARHLTQADCEAAQHAPTPTPDAVAELQPIAEFIVAARERGLKFPKLRVLDSDGESELLLGLTGPKSRVPGSVTVKRESEYLGLVRPTGEVVGPFSEALIARLVLVASDPATAAKQFAALRGSCSFCGATITDAGSIDVGYGPICAQRWGLPHQPQGTPVLSAPKAKAITHVLDATQDTPLGEVARLIYNSPCGESDMALYLEGTLDWVDDWAGIEETLNEELDLIYEGELEANQGRDEDQRIGYSDRHGN